MFTVFINREIDVFLLSNYLLHGVLLHGLGHEELLVVGLTVDDALVRGVGVQAQDLVALMTPETVFAPPRLFRHKSLDKVGFLPADFADFIDLDGWRLLDKLKKRLSCQ